MEYGVNARISLFFSNKLLADIQKIKTGLLTGEGPPNNMYLQGKMNTSDFFALYKDIFKFWYGRITNIERVLMWYPENLRKITDVMHLIMQGEGPLPLDWRYYIAIIVK